MSDWPVCEPFGPSYPELGAGVAKWRKVANKAGSIAAMARADVVAYADAIEKAIRAKHRALHMRHETPLPMRGDPRHDGSWHGREKAVYAAMMEAKRAPQINVAA